MSRTALLTLLLDLQADTDYEDSHGRADDALLAYINDAEVTAAYTALKRWYA